MTVDIRSKLQNAVSNPLDRCLRALVFSSLFVAITSPAAAQRQTDNQQPPWADTTGESDVYPVGDAVGVYRAVLDLLYIDGKERPPVIVLWSTPTHQFGGGPCTAAPCKDAWLHKSKIDTSAVLAFARQSPKRPRMIDFGYRTPIVLVEEDDFVRMAHDGSGYLAGRAPENVRASDAMWAGFRHKYPRAWGHARLSKVGFNSEHTEALVAVFQSCGEQCRSYETVFLKRIGKDWRVIERIPEYAEAVQASGKLRYRGPPAQTQSESQIIATDSSPLLPRRELDDAGKVYAAVLDRLYSFFGQSPRAIVLTENRTYGGGDLPQHRSRIDSSTIVSYNLHARVGDVSYPRFNYRLPVSWLNDSALKRLERQGASLAKAATEREELELSPLWLAFHAKYPEAWGYASFGNVGFNVNHSEALVFTKHFCGSACHNADTWFLERKGENWYVVERLSRDAQPNPWTVDGLRYLGSDADPKSYLPRRVQGVFTDLETGSVLPKLSVELLQGTQSRFIETDAEGRYSAENLQLRGLALKVKCPVKPGTTPVKSGPASILVGVVPVMPGMDTTVNVQVSFGECAQQ